VDGQDHRGRLGVVANPGDIPRSVVDDYEAQAKAAEAVAAMPGATPAQQARAVEARFVADNIATAAAFPNPARLRRPPAHGHQAPDPQLDGAGVLHVLAHAGNYPGLYAADKGQLDPNYTSLYDLPDLLMNRDGPLPNDRPHILRADGYYQQALGYTTR
jgi:hypothetical protein